MEEQTAAYRISGTVQGVGFRWWAVRQAQRLGLRGTVRNAPDGSVEIAAAGPSSALQTLRQLLDQGPPGARVAAVTALTPPDSLPRDFQITR